MDEKTLSDMTKALSGTLHGGRHLDVWTTDFSHPGHLFVEFTFDDQNYMMTLVMSDIEEVNDDGF